MRLIFCAAVLLLTTACEPQAFPPPPSTQLPPLPADLRQCLVQSGVKIPDRALTVADVERLWKSDRLRIAVMSRCGRRVIAWYDQLRETWR